jgi:hypothetical protein
MGNELENATTRDALVAALQELQQRVVQTVSGLTPAQFVAPAPGGGWGIAQQVEHLALSAKPLVRAYGLPPWLLRLVFGRVRRQGYTYAQVVRAYTNVLANGGVATGPYIPRAGAQTPAETLAYFSREHTALARALARRTEAQLDSCVLPHPLLGKITLREMLFFTLYHIGHHHQRIAELAADIHR